jgi:cytochrome c oxidase subunit 2
MPADSTVVIDQIFAVFIWFSVIAFVLTIGVMLYFLFRYHHKRNKHPDYDLSGNRTLEILWIVIPSIIGIGMFWYGWTGFSFITSPASESALELDVEAYQYGWEYEYPNGKTNDQLRVPKGRTVVLNITSRDVIHAFYAPAFRVKMDAVPSMVNTVHFTPQETGTFEVLCAEYCGLGHSSMTSDIVVVSQEEFTAWYQGGNEDENGNEDTQAASAE